MAGFSEQKKREMKKKKSIRHINTQDGGDALYKIAVDSHVQGDLLSAEKYYRELIKIGYSCHGVFLNLANIYKNRGQMSEAISIYKKAMNVNPTEPVLYSNLANIYINLGCYDQALVLTLKTLELRNDYPTAVKKLIALLGRIKQSPSNIKNVIGAYELVLNRTDISHLSLSKIFLQAFLPAIKNASASKPIICDQNHSLKVLSEDWRFCKSISLLIPSSSDAELFFTRLRKELLTLATHEGSIPLRLKTLTEALASQCYLNEYVYSTSQDEKVMVAGLVNKATENQEATNKFLAIVACYEAIHLTGIKPELIKNYPTPDYYSEELIRSQFNEPQEENEIKNFLQEKCIIFDEISKRVQEMYEVNPYPRFKYSDFTASNYSEPISNAIELETTRKNLSFPVALSSPGASPKILIAGCGTGNQVIIANRYQNAEITAIDLSSSSLAYAIRKTNEYEMNNTTFIKMDLLNISALGDLYDIIECSGVLHHMEQPSDGLSALVQQLSPGGYIKLGLYSEIARKVIVDARLVIQKLGIRSTPESIREFRRKVINGEIRELLDLPKFATDFYSLSACRDLCFHVKEHHFTIQTLKILLDDQGLAFCGFMLPEQIKKLYRKQYPEDRELTLLTNWAKFENENPSTFKGMYQFWAQRR